jgi:hypothetical protein
MWRAWNLPKTKLTFKVLFNLILWGLWIGLPLVSPAHQSHENGHPHPHANPEFSEHIWLELLTVVPLFYIITLVLVPYVFKRFGVFAFFASLFGMVALFFGIQAWYHWYFLPFDQHKSFFDPQGIFPLVMITGIASTYGLLLEFINFEAEKEELSNEQLKSELSFLRSQISPHFIFNILNSIVYLIRTKADKQAEDVTIRLSSLMRYMLYDSDQSMVSLDRELEYLRNYVDLQRMRFEGDVTIDFEVHGTVRGCRIEPMLLIPFVENAVKHGVSFVQDPYIHVLFTIEHGQLNFQVKNKKGKMKDDVMDESSGIGLKNVLRRLDLLYPDQHVLNIRDTEEVFEVDLQMTLQQQ